MVGGRSGIVVGSIVYTVAVVVAAAADWMSPSLTRGTPTAILEAAPALLLAAVALRPGIADTSRVARLCFAAAMVLLAGGVVVTSRVVADAPALVLGTVATVGVLLAVGYLFLLAGSSARRRRWTSGVTALLVILAALPASSAISAWANTPKDCGVDSCAFNGLAIVFGFVLAGLLLLFAVMVTAFAVDVRAGIGVLMFGAGIVLLSFVSPAAEQFESAACICIIYGGLALAALPSQAL